MYIVGALCPQGYQASHCRCKFLLSEFVLFLYFIPGSDIILQKLSFHISLFFACLKTLKITTG
jgi:hypothetical protein